MARFPQIDFFLLPLLVIGFSLRIVGIEVGLPDYPDAREPLIAQDILNLIHLEAPPEIHNWPGTAWFYLIAAIGKILEVFGFNLSVPRVIWLARLTNVLLSTATIWLTYQVGLRCYDRRVGRIGAGLLAVAMLHATNESRFALVDIPATFCVTLMLWLCARAQSISFRHTIWIGVIAGIGFAVKYTTVFAGLSAIPLLLRQKLPTSGLGLKAQAHSSSHLPTHSSRSHAKHRLLRLVTVIGVAATSFTIICPYWLIDLFSSEWNLFFDAFFYEAAHYRRGHFGLFATDEINWRNRFTYLWTLLRWGMGTPLAMLAILGLLLAILERRDGDKILLAFVLPYLLFIGSHKLKFVRHLLLIYPALTLLAAANIRRPEKLRLPAYSQKWGKGFAVAILGIVGGYSFIYTAAFASVMATPPTMIEASKWIEANIPANEAIEHEPEILLDWLLPKLDRDDDGEDARWVVILMPNAEIFLNYAAKPESYSEVDWYPIEGLDPEVAVEFYKRIFGDSSQYELAQTFERHPRFLGISISDQGAPFPIRALVHPEICIHRLQE